MVMVYAKHGKLPYRHFFKEWFSFVNKIKKEGLPYRDAANPAIKPVQVTVPQDVSSIQKSLNMGGACKACDLFCHMCACKSYGAGCQLMQWHEGHLRCQHFCLSQPNPPQKCFHWAVDDRDEIERKKQEIKVILMLDEIRSMRLIPECFQNNIIHPTAVKIFYAVNNKFPDYHIEEDPTVKAATQVLTSVTAANRYNDPRHIDFKCPVLPGTIRTAYSSFLDRELILRKIFWYCLSSAEVKQKYLKLYIHNGAHVIDLRCAIDWWCEIGENDKMIEIYEAVLCILHLELHYSEQIGITLEPGFHSPKNPKYGDRVPTRNWKDCECW